MSALLVTASDDLIVQNGYNTNRNAMNFMQIVYKMITYSHFTGSKVLCYGKTMLKKTVICKEVQHLCMM